MNYKHLETGHIKAVNPHHMYIGNLNPEWQAFDKTNPPIIWDGPEFDGTISEEEIEKFTEIFLDGDWYKLSEKGVEYMKIHHSNPIFRLASRPKEVEQPVQQEEPERGYKITSVQQEEYCELCFQRGGVKRTSCNSCMRDEMKNFQNMKKYEGYQLVQPSTPIVEEQREEHSCNLSDSELLERCDEWVDKLCKTGGKAWALSVPVNFKRDPDMLFTELAKRYKHSLSNREEGRELQWVEVEKRLPKNGVKVLIYCEAIGETVGYYWGNTKPTDPCKGWSVMNVTHWMDLPLSPSSTPLEQKELKDITEEDALLVGETIFETKEIQLKTNNSLAARVTFNDYELEICKRSSWIVLRRKAFIGMEQLPIKPLLLHKAYRYLESKGYKL